MLLRLPPELFTDLVNNLHLMVVLTAVLIGAICDIRGFRLPNGLTLTLLASGLLWNTASRGERGMYLSLVGIVISAFPLLLLYMRGAMGAGDVKLMAGIGSWMGAWFGLHVIIVAGIIGGLTGVMRHFGSNGRPTHLRAIPIDQAVKTPDHRRHLLPFGVMILCGVLLNIVFPTIQQFAR
jgi:Flp pilus assembly protein protease CpaA